MASDPLCDSVALCGKATASSTIVSDPTTTHRDPGSSSRASLARAHGMPDGLIGIASRRRSLGKRQGLNIILAKYTNPSVPTETVVTVLEFS